MSRLDSTRARFDDLGIDALYVSNLVNVRYLTGFTGSTAMLFVGRDWARMFVDPRYWVQASQQVSGAEVVNCSNRLSVEAVEAIRAMDIPRLGIEAGHLTVAGRDDLADRLPGTEIVSTNSVIEALRLVKDADEVSTIRRACAIVDDLFQYIQAFLKPGVREVDIALELEHEMRRRGAEAVGFASIIASGANGAKPHAGASSKPIEDGDFVTMDYGARVDGYNSDITRTVAIGHVTDKQMEVYNTVLLAQKAAVDALKPGISHVDADAVARNIIKDAGYGDFFGHGLGHSLGMDVHDGARLSPAADAASAVRPGEVWTIEPGIYIPDWGGVRIEDDVLVTASGPEVLTHAPKDLLVL